MPATRPVPLTQAVGRLLRSRHRIEFTRCDPFGHLGASAWLELAVNHRMQAVTEQLGFDTPGLAREQGLGFVLREARLDFRQPALPGDEILVESWIERLAPRAMEVLVRMRRQEDASLCCGVELRSVLVDLRRGRLVPLPETLPCRRADGFEDLPWAEGHPLETGPE